MRPSPSPFPRRASFSLLCRIHLAETKPESIAANLNQSHRDMTNVKIVYKDASDDASDPHTHVSYSLPRTARCMFFLFCLSPPFSCPF